MLKSIGYFFAYIWFMLFITGEPHVMELTIIVFFAILVIGYSIESISNIRHNKIKK